MAGGLVNAAHFKWLPRGAPPRPWPVQAGWPGLVALGAVLLTGVLALGVTPRWQAQAQQAQATQQQARAAWVRQQAQARASAPAPAPAQTGPVVPPLPAADTTPQRLADLLEQALRHGVRVDRLTQATAPAVPATVRAAPSVAATTATALPGRTTLQLQATGPLQALRAWASSALQHDAALSLDQLRWRRSAAGDGTLSAELQWSLWHSTPAAGPANVNSAAPAAPPRP